MISHVKESKVEELEPSIQELYNLAREVSTRACAPYSGFQVGAALRTEQAVFLGCNVENISYGLTCCAERSAVFAAVAAEGSSMKIREVVVYAKTETASPCGACRQVIAAFGVNINIFFSEEDHIIATDIGELLPYPFAPPGHLAKALRVARNGRFPAILPEWEDAGWLLGSTRQCRRVPRLGVSS